jgi:uncharacterized repeat protein (TIGR03803 family)
MPANLISSLSARSNSDHSSSAFLRPMTAFSRVLIACSLCLASFSVAFSQTITDLYNPPQNGDGPGTGSLAGLVRDSSGNLYGTTYNGGLDIGSVFELSPNGSGGYTGTTICSFGIGNCPNGSDPGHGPLILDSKGNLYGTTTTGGASGNGTVFELSPTGNGAWTQTILYDFTGGSYNSDPVNGLVMDSRGNLYGTTTISSEGSIYAGAVFELSPSPSGTWTEQLIYTYPQGNYAGLVIDPYGNIYGIGSTGDHPTAYELSLNEQGAWIPTILFTFPAVKPSYGPQGTLALDGKGNLYGTNYGNDPKSSGSVFELMRPNRRDSKKPWTRKTVHIFQGGTSDGANPLAGVLIGPGGNIYGTTEKGGTDNYGTVYELFNYGDGSFGEAVLANVADSGGIWPEGALILDASGNLYGTTAYGQQLGEVFEVSQ